MKILFWCLLAAPLFVQGQVQGEVELAGFLLGQHRKAVHREYGPPIEVRNPEGWLYEFHKLKPDTSVYALFKYAPADTSSIYGIQISGKHYAEMHPFLGLKLGATLHEVHAKLGHHDKTDTIDDVALLYFPHKNYSVDISTHHRLYGIQIFGNILKNKIGDHKPSIHGFRQSVVKKNIDSLVHHLHPRVQFITKTGTVTFYRGARQELHEGTTPLAKLLLGESGSVWHAFAKEFAEGTTELKVHADANETTSIDKFYDSTVIDQIVLKPHAGVWKVYQVKFR